LLPLFWLISVLIQTDTYLNLCLCKNLVINCYKYLIYIYIYIYDNEFLMLSKEGKEWLAAIA
jgi:hypothetical protein